MRSYIFSNENRSIKFINIYQNLANGGFQKGEGMENRGIGRGDGTITCNLKMQLYDF